MTDGDAPILRAPTMDEIVAARARLLGVAVRTPLIENPELNQRLGLRLLLKAEPLQRTGAFKLRGAHARISLMGAAEKARGVIAYSSGNHAQAVALAARLAGTDALIVMPEDAPQSKIAATRALGAEIRFYDRHREQREHFASRIEAETGRAMVPPNEDARVLAGAASLACEIAEQAEALGASPDFLLVPCGGGGLTAASALVAETQMPGCRVFAVEPEAFDDTRRSLLAGERLANPKGRKSICDAILTDRPGALTFEINQTRLDGALAVSDAEVCRAMALAFDAFHLVIEPGAAVALAAVLAGRLAGAEGRTVVAVATGGNVDPDMFCTCLKEGRKEGTDP